MSQALVRWMEGVLVVQSLVVRVEHSTRRDITQYIHMNRIIHMGAAVAARLRWVGRGGTRYRAVICLAPALSIRFHIDREPSARR